MTSATTTATADEAAATAVPATAAAPGAVPATAVAAPARRRLQARKEWALVHFTFDFVMLGLGVTVAETGWRGAGFEPTPPQWILVFPLLALVLLHARGAYVPRLHARLLDELRICVGATAVAAMAATTARVVATDDVIASTQAVRPWLFATTCLVAGRAVLGWADARARRRGESSRPTLILGAGRVGQLLAQRLLERPELGLRPIGFLDKEPLDRNGRLPVLGASWDLDRVVAEHGVENVIVTFSTAPHEVLLRLAKRSEELGIEVSFVPRLFEKVPERVSVDHLGGLPIITPRPVNPKGWQFAVKYLFDRVAAGALLVVLAPLLGLTALAVRISMGRPIFFSQKRVGLDGREFRMIKFRTMRGAPESSGEADAGWAAGELGSDPAAEMTGEEDRRTPIGRILRACSIDELPQLWNVLRGDMSLVGPRPEREHYARRFEESIYRYAERHRVKSGITGWAQVNGLRGRTSLADRVEWDNYYIENWSLWLDLQILARTPISIFTRQGE